MGLGAQFDPWCSAPPQRCYRGPPHLFSFIASDFNILIELSFSFVPVGGRGFTQAFTKAFLYTKEIIRLNLESFQWHQQTSISKPKIFYILINILKHATILINLH